MIREEDLPHVVRLKITGDINGYDIMVMHNKMLNLQHLDLTDANIVGSSYYNIKDSVLSNMSLDNLLTIKLPKNIKSIGTSAFEGCSNLVDVEFQPGLESIGKRAFYGCNNLKTIEIKDGLKTIGDNSFTASGLEKAILPEGLESIGSYAFGEKNYPSPLKEIVLLKGLRYIGSGAFAGTKLQEITLPEGLDRIDAYVYSRCNLLRKVVLPSSLKEICDYAFYQCNSLDSIHLPELTYLGVGVFGSCRSLKNVNLPPSLTIINSSTFSDSGLEELHIPSNITTIGENAFACPNLKDVYVYVVEPTKIPSNTFSNYKDATLHVPSTSYYNYWYDESWSQFGKVEEFNAQYDYFYLNNDFVISDEKGTVQGDSIDVDLHSGSGLVVETAATNKQQFNVVNLNVEASKAASILSNDNLDANKLNFNIAVVGGRWYFLSFPFRVSLSNVAAPEPHVWRYYDSSQRALGRTGWKDWTEDYLLPNQGYIFQASGSGMLTVSVEYDDLNWQANTRQLSLSYHQAESRQHASWNYMGNPHTAYYDISETNFTQPITVWNGSSYVAVRPGDDVFALSPLQAFFVQKPDNQATMDFPSSGCYTYSQWQYEQQKKAEARRMRNVKEARLLVNLSLSNELTSDKTRVVFNRQKQLGYEMECDAAKFLAAGVPQLYSTDQEQCLYAINERPLGEVRLGYVAPAKGRLTIRAERMDQPMLLRDNLLQLTHDFTTGDYTFETEAGTHDNRFTLIADESVMGIAQLQLQTGIGLQAEQGGIGLQGVGEQTVNIYSVDGTLMANPSKDGFVKLPKAAYIVKVGNSTAKVMVK